MNQLLKNISEALRLLPIVPAGMNVVYLPIPVLTNRRYYTLPNKMRLKG